MGFGSYQLLIDEITTISHVNLFSDRVSHFSVAGQWRIQQSWWTGLHYIRSGENRVSVRCIMSAKPSTLSL